MPILDSPRPSRLPYPEHPVPDLLARSARLWPDAVALVDGATDAEYTFARLHGAVRGMARALQDEGIGKGDRVAIVAPNSPEWVVAFQGALLAGATVTTLNPLYRPREIRHQFDDSGPKVVFASGVTEEAVRSVWEGDDGLHLTADAWSMADGAGGDPEPVDIDPRRDLAVLPYSSGTTGPPKGVMLTHFNLVANTHQMLGSGLVDRYSTMIDFLPFFHIYGMSVLMNTGLAAGATQVVMGAFDPGRFLQLIAERRATNLFVVPPAMVALAHLGQDVPADLSSVRFVMSGAAPLPAEIAATVADRYDVEVVQGYGMTEASPVTHVSILGRDKAGTVGPPVADTRQKVVDPGTGDEVSLGEVGELLVEGPQVMQGYFGRDDATAESILVDRSEADAGAHPWSGRWLRTGDIVTMDDEGYVTIHDRAKEMIKYRGYQIAPAELEGVLVEHPDIADAAVSSKPSDDGSSDELAVAFVVAREGTDLTAEMVKAHVEERVAPYKKIREVRFVEAIPKNASGKILRRELKETLR
jgi:acyl-CoA synthetase (AMP-forming)/AMP-acid ligase II